MGGRNCMANSKSQIADRKEVPGDCHSQIANGEAQTAEGELAMGKPTGAGQRRSEDVTFEARD